MANLPDSSDALFDMLLANHHASHMHLRYIPITLLVGANTPLLIELFAYAAASHVAHEAPAARATGLQEAMVRRSGRGLGPPHVPGRSRVPVRSLHLDWGGQRAHSLYPGLELSPGPPNERRVLATPLH